MAHKSNRDFCYKEMSIEKFLNIEKLKEGVNEDIILKLMTMWI